MGLIISIMEGQGGVISIIEGQGGLLVLDHALGSQNHDALLAESQNLFTDENFQILKTLRIFLVLLKIVFPSAPLHEI